MSRVSSLRLLRVRRGGGGLGRLSLSTHFLSFESSGDERSDKVAVFLHGLMGTKTNWRTPVRLFQQRHPDFRCIAIDSRGHGESAAVSKNEPIESNTLQSCAIDLDNFLKHMNISPSPLFGHSMVFVFLLMSLYLHDIECFLGWEGVHRLSLDENSQEREYSESYLDLGRYARRIQRYPAPLAELCLQRSRHSICSACEDTISRLGHCRAPEEGTVQSHCSLGMQQHRHGQ